MVAARVAAAVEGVAMVAALAEGGSWVEGGQRVGQEVRAAAAKAAAKEAAATEAVMAAVVMAAAATVVAATAAEKARQRT